MTEYQHVIRIYNTDLKGEKPIRTSLTKIRGVGYNFARVICSVSGIDPAKQAGKLSPSEVKIIEEVIQMPLKHGIPAWFLNRRNDYETGQDMHLTMGDLKFSKDNDIKREQKTKSYRGLRHALGLTVRGQRTKSNFRKNKGKAVGGKKKTAMRK